MYFTVEPAVVFVHLEDSAGSGCRLYCCCEALRAHPNDSLFVFQTLYRRRASERRTEYRSRLRIDRRSGDRRTSADYNDLVYRRNCYGQEDSVDSRADVQKTLARAGRKKSE